ncbi:hypothetical protein FHY15_001656 [Xanthomonas arboricola]|nr:hypothetical protein [Xanthomonas arboricola]
MLSRWQPAPASRSGHPLKQRHIASTVQKQRKHGAAIGTHLHPGLAVAEPPAVASIVGTDPGSQSTCLRALSERHKPALCRRWWTGFRANPRAECCQLQQPVLQAAPGKERAPKSCERCDADDDVDQTLEAPMANLTAWKGRPGVAQHRLQQSRGRQADDDHEPAAAPRQTAEICRRVGHIGWQLPCARSAANGMALPAMTNRRVSKKAGALLLCSDIWRTATAPDDDEHYVYAIALQCRILCRRARKFAFMRRK